MRNLAFLCSGLLAAAPLTLRANEAQTYEAFIDYAGQICPGHSKERTTPGIRNVKIEALQVLAKRGYFLCPDRRIENPGAVVWYADPGVFEWNPESPASVKALREITDKLTRSEDFPNALTVWDAGG
ncbi:MAG: hypothetical protein IJI03_04915, partial [Rudaea sp.]|nr:hypothetical protein [Rudaea sp.]